MVFCNLKRGCAVDASDSIDLNERRNKVEDASADMRVDYFYDK